MEEDRRSRFLILSLVCEGRCSPAVPETRHRSAAGRVLVPGFILQTRLLPRNQNIIRARWPRHRDRGGAAARKHSLDTGLMKANPGHHWEKRSQPAQPADARSPLGLKRDNAGWEQPGPAGMPGP